MRPVGGWANLTNLAGTALQVTGIPRAAHSWRSGNGLNKWLAVGTNTGIFVYGASVLTDITEAGTVAGSGSTSGAALPYGSGLYGIGPYGGGGAAGGGGGAGQPLVIDENATWVLDNFGDFLVGVLSSDGVVRKWDADLTTDMIAVAVGTEVPVSNRGVVVTPERFLLVLGANGNPRMVKWPNQETMDEFTASATTTAGEFELATNGRLMTGKRTTRETLLFTDTDLWAAIFIGGTLIYSFEPRGADCGIISPNAAGVVGDGAMWMSDSGFFRYDGSVSKIPCEVFDYVFTRLNRAQKLKIAAITNAQFGEITWQYPSVASQEIDSYVTYNWLHDIWYFGSLSRTCGVDAQVFPYPLLMDADGYIYEHERGSLRTGETVFAESGPFEIGDGGNTVMMRHLYPDERTLGDVTITLYSAFHPTGPETTNGPYVGGRPTGVRVTGRQVRVRLTEAVTNTDWRVGTYRADVVPAGER